MLFTITAARSHYEAVHVLENEYGWLARDEWYLCGGKKVPLRKLKAGKIRTRVVYEGEQHT